MNVYDFDGTIYCGDSTIDFYLYNLKHHPRLLFYLPKQIWGMVTYRLGVIDKTKCKEEFYSFLNGLEDVEQDVVSFWARNRIKIKKWYLNNRKDDDIIVSASPDFLLTHICNELKVHLICSKVDGHTGRYNGKNCYGMEKVRRFKEEYGSMVLIDNFYSDSLSDTPMAAIAQRSFRVSGENIKRWDKSNF